MRSMKWKKTVAVAMASVMMYTGMNVGSLTAAAQEMTDVDVSIYNDASGNVSLKSGSEVKVSGTIVYGNNLSVLSLNNSGSDKAVFENSEGDEVTGKLTWKDDTIIPKAGESTQVWKFTPDDVNYNPVEGDVTVNVSKATPTIKVAPTIGEITYGKKVSDVKITDGAMLHTLLNEDVAGTFAWDSADADKKPSVSDSKKTEYNLVFTPDDTDNFNTVTIKTKIKVNKATPVVDAMPAIGAISYGSHLADATITGGVVAYDNELVDGTFSWDSEDAIKIPTASDSEKTEYTLVFVPTDAVNFETLNIKTTITIGKASPEITGSSTLEVVYNPDVKLDDYDMSAYKAVINKIAVPGELKWEDGTVIPTAGTKEYKLIFTPEDTDNYAVVKKTITVKVNKATPVVKTLPTIGAIKYGQYVSDATVTGGEVQYSETNEKEIPGAFAWDSEEAIKVPAISDSEKTEYKLIFIPEDSANYNTFVVNAKIKINKLDKAPNMPIEDMTVPYETKKVSEVSLDETWKWNVEDADKELVVGEAVKATAIYVGEDAGIYEKESVVVNITRSGCKHNAETEIKDKVDATCTEDGYTGDTYCKICNEKVESGKVIPATGHAFEETWTYDVHDHWKKSTCGHDVIDEKAPHVYDNNNDAICNVCGREREVDSTGGKIKGICQIPYGMVVPGESGFLIGLETYANPERTYQYEMLILDCTLLAEGKDAWVYTTGKKTVPENCFWTIWQPKYGYYWTLFRVYDMDGNILDEQCYGFQNI